MNAFAEKLLTWYDQSGRHDLPWQQDKTPYRVWVSEIMLQQTQVQTVVGYYQKFMQSFPSLQALAQATQDEVLAHWAGLGYYARGRNLHKAAQIVQQEFGGTFPTTYDEIVALPGIGKSTAGAILALALQQRYPILDGNVKRVLCRFEAIETWSGEKQTEQLLWKIAEALTPHERFDDYTQAMMDLGATLCRRSKPQCESCPVKSECKAFKLNQTTQLPVSKPKIAKPTRSTVMGVLQNEAGEVALIQRPQKGIWGGLWSLPEFENEVVFKKALESYGEYHNLIEYEQIKHTFTHYHLNILPFGVFVKNPQAWADLTWVNIKLQNKGVPTPVKMILERIQHV